MKKVLTLSLLFVVLFSIEGYSQLHKSQWQLGFGGAYERNVGVEQTGNEGDFGFWLSIERDVSEHVAIRLMPNYKMLSVYAGGPETTLMGADIDFVYSFVPCEPISPYFVAGLGGYSQELSGGINVPDDTYLMYQVNMALGLEWKVLGPHWSIKTELAYHHTNNDKLDGYYPGWAGGNVSNGGIWSGSTDGYMDFQVGLQYAFGKGEESKLCQLYSGIEVEAEDIDYGRIEEIVKKYATEPTEVDYDRIDEMIKRCCQSVVGVARTNYELDGVHFEFDSAKIRPVSKPILDDAAEVLKENPNINVEIIGHTDNKGTEEYNRKLSLERANSVKQYLVEKGISASRLTTKGMGEEAPRASNATDDGRAENRRIEFRVID